MFILNETGFLFIKIYSKFNFSSAVVAVFRLGSGYFLDMNGLAICDLQWFILERAIFLSEERPQSFDYTFEI